MPIVISDTLVMAVKQVEVSKGEEILTESHNLTSRLTSLPANDQLHEYIRALTSQIADVTSLSDVISRKLDNTAKVYEHLDQVTSLLTTHAGSRNSEVMSTV